MFVNGKEILLEQLKEKNLNGLLKYLNNKSNLVAISINNVIIPITERDATSLNKSDIIEIIHFVGGG